MNRALKRGKIETDVSKGKSKTKETRKTSNSPSDSPVNPKTTIKKTAEPIKILKKKSPVIEEITSQTKKEKSIGKKQSPKEVESDHEIIKEEEGKTIKKNVRSPEISPSQAKVVTIKVDEGVNIVFVGNLPLRITENEITKFFANCGKIIEVRMSKNPMGFSKGYCHIEFDNTSSVKQAVLLNGKEISGRILKVDPSRPSKSI